MSRISDLHTGWMKDPAYRRAYDALEREFALAGALIRARADADLTQEQLAERMGTKQAVVARWESGNAAVYRRNAGCPIVANSIKPELIPEEDTEI